MNKKNTPFAESIMNCGATFLNPDTTPSLCYKAAKEFVDEYEREEREQRHVAQGTAKTLDDWIREMKTYASSIYDFSKKFADIYEREELGKRREEHEQRHVAQGAAKTLDDWIREMKTYASSIYDFSKKFADIYEREELGKRREEHEQRHEAQAVPVNWSIEKDNAYHALTEAIFKRETLTTIQKAAITFADICNREERKKPETGEVYRDIFGNNYIVVGVYDEEPFKKSFVTLIYFNAKVELRSSEVFTVPLEDFMNPTFKKI